MNAEDIYLALGDVETALLDLGSELRETDPAEWGKPDNIGEAYEFLADATVSVGQALDLMKRTVHLVVDEIEAA